MKPTPKEAAQPARSPKTQPQPQQRQMWNTMPTQVLLEQAWALSQRRGDSEAAGCIDALIWRLKGAEEWIASQARQEVCQR